MDTSGYLKQISDGKISDLSEFCEIWPKLKPAFLEGLESRKFDQPGMQETIIWLTKLADKVFFEIN